MPPVCNCSHKRGQEDEGGDPQIFGALRNDLGITNIQAHELLRDQDTGDGEQGADHQHQPRR